MRTSFDQKDTVRATLESTGRVLKSRSDLSRHACASQFIRGTTNLENYHQYDIFQYQYEYVKWIYLLVTIFIRLIHLIKRVLRMGRC